MSQRERGLEQRAAELRRAFDQAFAQPEASAIEALLELLLIRVRGHAYALRLGEVLGLHADRKLVPVPGPRPELLGLTGVRGQVVPVYDLGLLLGYPAGPAPRWVALVRSSTPFAVGFEQFEAHSRVSSDAVALAPSEAPQARRFASATLATSDGVRPLIDLTALVADVTRNRHRSVPEREERR